MSTASFQSLRISLSLTIETKIMIGYIDPPGLFRPSFFRIA